MGDACGVVKCGDLKLRRVGGSGDRYRSSASYGSWQLKQEVGGEGRRGEEREGLEDWACKKLQAATHNLALMEGPLPSRHCKMLSLCYVISSSSSCNAGLPCLTDDEMEPPKGVLYPCSANSTFPPFCCCPLTMPPSPNHMRQGGH